MVSGLLLENGQGTGDGVKLAGHHCRLTAVRDRRRELQVLCPLRSAQRTAWTIAISRTRPTTTRRSRSRSTATPNRHRVDHNHFGPRPPLGRNGGETIRVGYSHQSMSASGTMVESNLFDRCDGEIEIISSKSCDNIYRANTFLDCAGMLTLRHGNRCLVEGNFFLGHHKRGSGGIRVIGDDHVVINNYIDGVENGGILDHVRAFRIRSSTAIFRRAGAWSPSTRWSIRAGRASNSTRAWHVRRRSLRPEKITIANNLFAPGNGRTASQGHRGRGWTWTGNVAAGRSHGLTRACGQGAGAEARRAPRTACGGLPRRVRVRGADARESWPTAKTDIDGQPRSEPLDAGCDQLSALPVTNRPLTAKDVGPSWMDRHPPPAEKRRFGSGMCRGLNRMARRTDRSKRRLPSFDDIAALSALANGIIPPDCARRGGGGGSCGAGDCGTGAARAGPGGLRRGLNARREDGAEKVRMRAVQPARSTARSTNCSGCCRRSSPAFFRQLRADVCALYLSDPGVWQRIGFPGPSTETGGYPDFDQPQTAPSHHPMNTPAPLPRRQHVPRQACQNAHRRPVARGGEWRNARLDRPGDRATRIGLPGRRRAGRGRRRRAARRAFIGPWRKLTPYERGRLLQKARA